MACQNSMVTGAANAGPRHTPIPISTRNSLFMLASFGLRAHMGAWRQYMADRFPAQLKTAEDRGGIRGRSGERGGRCRHPPRRTSSPGLESATATVYTI